jgi:hypothetical protein
MEVHGQSGSTWNEVVRILGRLICGANGHSFVMCFEPDRLRLECSACGYRSHGWEVRRLARAASLHTVLHGDRASLKAGSFARRRQAA